MKNTAIIFLAFLLVFILILSCGCKKGRWSKEWEERFEEWQPTEKILDIFEVKKGMVVGEIGAGNGRFAVKVAHRVGNEGLVYANDIDPKAIKFMKKRLKKENIFNMIVVEGKIVHPGFPLLSLDLVYMVNTYDHLSQPVYLMKNVSKSLKPDGRLVIMAYDTAKTGALKGHAVSKTQVIQQAKEAGYRLVKMDTSLSKDTIYLFCRDDLGGGKAANDRQWR